MTGDCEIVSFTPTDELEMFIVDFDSKGQDKLTFVEFLFNDKENGRFLYARNHDIFLPLSQAILTSCGIKYLAPEMVLLYKSTDTERKGYQLDYDMTVGAMTAEQRAWLWNALKVMNPNGHKWLKANGELSMGSNNSNNFWEAIADDWDTRVGDDGNDFHRELIRPATLRMLNPQTSERILDAACGNGVFARYLAELGVEVVAFDYSPAMIEHARERSAAYSKQIAFTIADATDYGQMLSLGNGKPFDKAVANMAVMGIPDIEPLFKAVFDMLKPGGVFVFSATHPCFQTPDKSFTPDGRGVITTDYITPKRYSYQILTDNPKCAYHWHRPLQELFRICVDAGFVIDGLEEPVFVKGSCTHSVWENVPLPIVIRVQKIKEYVS